MNLHIQRRIAPPLSLAATTIARSPLMHPPSKSYLPAAGSSLTNSAKTLLHLNPKAPRPALLSKLEKNGELLVERDLLKYHQDL